MDMQSQARLSNRNGFTVFQFGKHTIRFRAPYSLERYTAIKEWDNGYIVAMAKYTHSAQPEEEYIDFLCIWLISIYPLYSHSSVTSTESDTFKHPRQFKSLC